MNTDEMEGSPSKCQDWVKIKKLTSHHSSFLLLSVSNSVRLPSPTRSSWECYEWHLQLKSREYTLLCLWPQDSNCWPWPSRLWPGASLWQGVRHIMTPHLSHIFWLFISISTTLLQLFRKNCNKNKFYPQKTQEGCSMQKSYLTRPLLVKLSLLLPHPGSPYMIVLMTNALYVSGTK